MFEIYNYTAVWHLYIQNTIQSHIHDHGIAIRTTCMRIGVRCVSLYCRLEVLTIAAGLAWLGNITKFSL